MESPCSDTVKCTQAETPVPAAPKDAAESNTSDQLVTPPALADKYRLVKPIGRGTQGKVFLAEKLDDHTGVAIKQLLIDSVTNWKAYDLFHREAEVLASLRIDGVAHFIEAIECLDDKQPASYIIQDYISGLPLSEMLKNGHRFSLDRVYDIVLQLLNILQKLHSHVPPVIHRDIKPSNIILHPLGGDLYKVFLIDFGAVANPKVQGGGSTVAGTYGYMPPEQLTGKPQPESDIYSLAAVMVHIITGKSPATMPAKDFRLIFEPDMQNMPPALVSTLRQMLDPDLSKRLTDKDEIRKRLNLFKQSVYKIDSEQIHVNDLSEEEYDARLCAVEFFGQDGNFELWQRLTEKTPRSVPLPYQDFKRLTNGKDSIEIIKNNNPNIVVMNGFIKLDEVQTKNYKKNMWICLVTAIIVGLMALRSTDRYAFVFSSVFGTLCLVFLIMSFYYFVKMYILDNISPVLYPIHEPHYVINDNIQAILQNGRKNVATIVDIQYVPSRGEYLQVYMKAKNKIGKSFIYAGKPTFKITYTFNPPDDAREEDIRHICFTHIEPEGHYKVGDPLPILYQFYRRQRNNEQTNRYEEAEYVESMPFPLPLGDVCKMSDIACLEEVMLDNVRKANHAHETGKVLFESEDFSKGIEF